MYSLTLALDGGEWLASRFGRFIPGGKKSAVTTEQKTGWVPEPV